MTVRLSLSVAVSAVCVACSLFGPQWELKRGVIEFYRDPTAIELPDTVQAGVSTIITVFTFGGGCVRAGFTEVSVDGLTAVVEPYDSVHVGAEVCTLEQLLFPHQASLQFTRRGTATVRVVGRSEPADTVLTVIRHLVVR